MRSGSFRRCPSCGTPAYAGGSQPVQLFVSLLSTVLEQDHFYSVFLCLLATGLTNSQHRDDEPMAVLRCWKVRSSPYGVIAALMTAMSNAATAERCIARAKEVNACESLWERWTFPIICPTHTFSAFWLRSSVVSVLISMTTDMLPNGSKSCHSIFVGAVV